MPNSPFPPGAHVAAYLRDSGHEDQELSTSHQEANLRAFCTQNGLILAEIYRDEARPGSTTVGREAFHRMIHDFRTGAHLAGLIVWKFARFARNIDDAQFYKADLRRRGFRIYSLNDTIPDGPEGRFFETAIDWMNERYLEDLSIDIKDGLKYNFTHYGAVPGTPPAGFRRGPEIVIGHHRDGRPRTIHRWEPDPLTAPLARRAWEMRAAGASLKQIADATGLFKSLNGWTTFFANRLYLGIMVYAGETAPNYCDPIIDQATWDTVQSIIQANAANQNLRTNNHPRRNSETSPWLLSGLAVCAVCGSPLNGGGHKQINGKIVTSYECSRKRRRRDCASKAIPKDLLETGVLQDIRNYILTPGVLASCQAVIAAENQTQAQNIQQEKKRIKAKLTGVRKRLDNITEALSMRPKSRSLLKKHDTLEAEEAKLLASLSETEKASTPITLTPDEIDNIAPILQAQLSGTPQEVKQFLRGWIKNIIVERDGRNVLGLINYYLPPTDLTPPSTPTDDNNVSMPRTPPGALYHRHIFTHPFRYTLK